ncbi:MerR family transcriptional regulator [Pseudonocardia humida]|uniref:MerR family transcriptional regulator n=1 Tax=Pseudonocardia humida TaxID=2800819 RepID=A0ABT0ZTX6_9PSEU|nr:MerR family transcriptional regulator [Pseudonocardia humida]MCO1654140.1 MerR family transcriptional regulator [Pseudonocardia humida]
MPGEQGRADDVLGVAAVARRLGVAPATLRSWHRRYGIGPSSYSSGARRAYTAEDVARLEAMHAAMVRGASAADAARTALATGLGASTEPTPPSGRQGGRGLRLPDAGPRVRGLGRAASALDAEAVDAVLDDSITALGVAATWDGVARPVLVAIAERWQRTSTGVETEHLLSECLLRAFHRVVDRAPVTRSGRPVLLAAVPGEAHHLPLSALAAVVAERGVGARSLAALPEASLRAAVDRTGPAAVFLWAHGPGPHLEGLFTDLPRPRPGCRWIVGGPGWAGQDLPGEVLRCDTLSEAADQVERAGTG